MTTGVMGVQNCPKNYVTSFIDDSKSGKKILESFFFTLFSQAEEEEKRRIKKGTTFQVSICQRLLSLMTKS